MKIRLFLMLVMVSGLMLLLMLTMSAHGTYARPEDGIAPATDGTGASTTLYLPLTPERYPSFCVTPPTLISPANGSLLDTLIPVLVYKKGSFDARLAKIYIADNPDFDHPILYSSSSSGVGPYNLRLFHNLEPATTYYWRVQDFCGSYSSPFSEVFTFTTGSGGVILPAPTLLSPPDGTVNVGEEITATWSSVTGAVGYQLWRRQSPRGGSLLTFLSGTSLVLRNLQPNTTYEWYVKAYNDYAYGDSSEVWHFTTGSFSSGEAENTPWEEGGISYSVRGERAVESVGGPQE